jgi:hypothetical protein
MVGSYKYWMLTPDQATDDPEKSPQDPVRMVARAVTGNGNVRAEEAV